MAMKRIVQLLTAAVMTIAAFGCSKPETKKEIVTVKPEKILIAYYSWSGNTKAAAEQIQKVTGGTLFRIGPVKPYPRGYNECLKQAKKEIDSNFKPDLAAKVESYDKYEVIFIGSPNWYGTIAPPVASFLSKYDLKGKTIIPFITHGGGGMQRCEEGVRKQCKEGTVLKAAGFSGGSVKSSGDKIAQWAKSCVDLK